MSHVETEEIQNNQSIIIQEDTIKYDLYFCEDSLEGVVFRSNPFDKEIINGFMAFLDNKNIDYQQVYLKQFKGHFKPYDKRILIQSGKLVYQDSFAVTCNKPGDLGIR